MTTFDCSTIHHDELNVGGVRYKPDASGAFVVPRHIADMVVAHAPGGFYRGPDVAPAPQLRFAFNPVFNFNGGVTLANDVERQTPGARIGALRKAEHVRRHAIRGQRWRCGGSDGGRMSRPQRRVPRKAQRLALANLRGLPSFSPRRVAAP